MRTDAPQYQGAISNIFLPGTILLANIDMTGLLEYALKAATGGAIWLGYKMVADYMERRKESRDTKAGNQIKKGVKKSEANGIGE